MIFFIHLKQKKKQSISSVLGDHAMSCLATNVEMKHLNLSGCSITDIGLSYIGKLINMETLNICDCASITDAGIEHLRPLTNLTHITLSGCSLVGDASMSVIGTLVTLRSLHVTSCYRITDEGIEALVHLLKLQELGCGSNPNITDASIRVLMRRLPSLRGFYLRGAIHISDAVHNEIQQRWVKSGDDPFHIS
jgi:hypothetical protein